MHIRRRKGAGRVVRREESLTVSVPQFDGGSGGRRPGQSFQAGNRFGTNRRSRSARLVDERFDRGVVCHGDNLREHLMRRRTEQVTQLS